MGAPADREGLKPVVVNGAYSDDVGSGLGGTLFAGMTTRCVHDS